MMLALNKTFSSRIYRYLTIDSQSNYDREMGHMGGLDREMGG
jgi:hypothetical protein